MVGGAVLDRLHRPARRAGRSADPVYSSRTCCGSPGPRCRSPRGRSGRAGAASTADSPRPRCELPATLALVIVGAIASCPSRGHLSDAAARAARPAGRARGRHAEARLLRRARLVRHPDVRAPRRARVEAWFDAYLHGMPDPVARLFRDTEAGYRPSFSILAIGSSAFAHVAVARAGAAGAALESPRRPQLGRRNDAPLGALLDDLAALPRLAAQLPHGRAGARRCSCRRKAASPAAISASRSARCSSISPARDRRARRCSRQ